MLNMTSPPSSEQPLMQQFEDLLQLQYRVILKLQHQKEKFASGPSVSEEDYQELYRELQDEKVEHARTRSELTEEREKLTFARREVQLLSRQLEREKATFENAFGLLKSQALADSSKTEDLIAKCTALEALCSHKDEELTNKDKTIECLQQRMKSLEVAHKQQLQELKVQMQQEVYMAKKLGTGKEKVSSRRRK